MICLMDLSKINATLEMKDVTLKIIEFAIIEKVVSTHINDAN